MERPSAAGSNHGGHTSDSSQQVHSLIGLVRTW
jgi:hypothetical protein